MGRRFLMTCAAIAAALAAATPAAAYREALESQGSRFEFLSELNSLGEDRPLLLKNCGHGGPGDLSFVKIRQYFDRRSGVHLWVITTERRKDVLYYASGQLSCVIEQQ